MSDTPVAAPSGGNNTPSQGAPSSVQPPSPTSLISGGASGTTPASPPSSTDIFEVKVNGKTVKMTRQEVIDHASMSHAANDKFNEAKKTRSEVDRIIKSAKSNPIEALMDPALGLTKDQIRDAFEKWYAKEYIEPETLTADQKRIREQEERLSKYEQQDKEKKEREEKEQEDKLTHHQREFLQGQIIEALEKSNLPKTKETVRKIAFYMRQNLANGWEAPMEMIIRQVKNDRQGSFRDEIENCSIEQAVELLGEGFMNKVRSHDLQKLRERRQLPGQVSNPRAGTGPLDESKKISSSEVNRRLRDMRLGKI